MQTVSDQFTEDSQADMRRISGGLKVSFDKTFDDAVNFFTLDESVLDGDDLLAPSDGNVIQEWDKYVYASYFDRVIQMEWQREEDIPYSMNLAIADIVLANHDNLFTQGAGGALDAYLLPRRPLKIFAGFKGNTIPQFVGLSTKAPRIDYAAKTATIHAQDFLSFILEKPLDNVVVLQDKYTHEVLEVLFEMVGLLPGQYVLDESFNRINFVYFEKDTRLGDAIRKLMQAELGSLYMDEFGVIRFRNRVREAGASVYTFDKSNTINVQQSDEGEIINVVEIKSAVREVQAVTNIYELTSALVLPTGSSEHFFNFDDPVTTIQAVTDYTANANEDGSGANLTGSVTVTDTDLFTASVKITFNNVNPAPVYLTELNLTGTPATVVRDLYLREKDDASIAKYEEQVLTIENDYIQNDSLANSVALSILNYYREYGGTIELEVKGNPALQIGDNILVDVDTINQEYTITKIASVLIAGQYRQLIKGKIFNIPAFFTLDASELDGSDVLAP